MSPTARPPSGWAQVLVNHDMSPPGPAMKPSSDIVTEYSSLPMIHLRSITSSPQVALRSAAEVHGSVVDRSDVAFSSATRTGGSVPRWLPLRQASCSRGRRYSNRAPTSSAATAMASNGRRGRRSGKFVGGAPGRSAAPGRRIAAPAYGWCCRRGGGQRRRGWGAQARRLRRRPRATGGGEWVCSDSVAGDLGARRIVEHDDCRAVDALVVRDRDGAGCSAGCVDVGDVRTSTADREEREVFLNGHVLGVGPRGHVDRGARRCGCDCRADGREVDGGALSTTARPLRRARRTGWHRSRRAGDCDDPERGSRDSDRNSQAETHRRSPSFSIRPLECCMFGAPGTVTVGLDAYPVRSVRVGRGRAGVPGTSTTPTTEFPLTVKPG